MRILASHQPNFMPYMGYFYKMYVADAFSIADEVLCTRDEFHNYNYIWENGGKRRITVPISSHSKPFKEVKLVDWDYHKNKISKRLKQAYSRYPFFNDVYPLIDSMLQVEYQRLIDLNWNVLIALKMYFGIKTPIIHESRLGLKYNNPNEDIIEICKALECDGYITGSGSIGYMKPELFEQNGIKLFWTKYEPTINRFGGVNMSAIDYALSNGSVIPEQWKKDKEMLHNGV